METLANYKQLTRDLWCRPENAPTLPNLEGKVYIVTGASSGIGAETATLLAGAGAKVWLLGRTESRLNKTVASIVEKHPGANLEFALCEYENLETIKPVAKRILSTETRLDGVIHNAGINWNGLELTSLGLDKIIVVNALAGFLLQRFLDPLLEKTAESSPANSVRIIWIASSAHYLSPPNGGINWQNMNVVANGAAGFGVYGQTKAMNIYQAMNWPRKHPGSKVICVAVHPGMIVSDIRRQKPDREGVMDKLCRPTVYGAYSELAPLFDANITTADSGTYYVPIGEKGRVRPDVLEAAQGEAGLAFWEWCKSRTEEYYQA